MSILSINRDVLSQFSHRRCLLFLSISLFPLLFPKPSLFPAYHQTCLRKMMISDSFTIGSSCNLSTRFGSHFQTFSPLGIKKKCLIKGKYPIHHSFFFSRRNPKLFP